MEREREEILAAPLPRSWFSSSIYPPICPSFLSLIHFSSLLSTHQSPFHFFLHYLALNVWYSPTIPLHLSLNISLTFSFISRNQTSPNIHQSRRQLRLTPIPCISRPLRIQRRVAAGLLRGDMQVSSASPPSTASCCTSTVGVSGGTKTESVATWWCVESV